MELVNVGKSYKWKEHDSFELLTRKYLFGTSATKGDTVKLVQLIKTVVLNEVRG